MPKRSTANSATIPPPVNGINTKDPISGMDQLFALEAVNFISKNGGVELREGSRYHSKDVTYNPSIVTDIVMALGVISNNLGANRLIAFGSGFFLATSNIHNAVAYDATTPGSAAPIYTGGAVLEKAAPCIAMTVFQGKIWYPASGVNLFIKYWDGASATETNVAVPINDVRLIFNYKNRLYYTRRKSIYWGGVNAIAGFVIGDTYDVASLLSYGGNIIYGGDMSRGQAQSDNYMILVSDTGEILLFQGEYPASPTWSIVGRFKIPQPCGARAFVKYGSDILVLTVQGVVSILDVIQGNQVINFLSDNIGDYFSDFSSIVNYNYGVTAPIGAYFSGVWWPDRGWIVFTYVADLQDIINGEPYPTMRMIVYDTKNSSWWRWDGINAYSLAVLNGELYIGTTDGRVFKMTGDFDEDPANEGAVLTRTIKLRPAYNYFGDRSASKQFVEARPILKQSEGLTLTMDADVDYQDTTATNTVTDLTNTAYKLYAPRVGLQGIGRCASIRIDGTVTTKRFRLEATEVIWNDGDI